MKSRLSLVLVLSLVLSSCIDVSYGVKSSLKKFKGSICKIHYTIPGGVIFGTGFLYESQDTIVTAGHVVEDALSNKIKPEDIIIKFEGDDQSYTGVEVEKSALYDIAVIRFNRKPGDKAKALFKFSDKLPEQGDFIWFAGYPGGDEFSVKMGTIESLEATDDNNDLKLDSACFPGYSGAAICDSEGNLITIIVRTRTDYQGTSFGVCIKHFRSEIKVLMLAIINKP